MIVRQIGRRQMEHQEVDLVQNLLAAILIPLGAIAFVGLAVSGLGTLLLQLPAELSIWIALGVTFAILGGAILLSSLQGSTPAERH